MINYEKSIKLAKMLNLSKGNLDLYQSAIEFLPSFLQKPALHQGINIGLNVGLSLASENKVREFIEADNANTIRLMFPNMDFGFNYKNEEMRKNWDKDIVPPPKFEVGGLVPHIKLKDGQSLREKMAHICIQEGKSYEFKVFSGEIEGEPKANQKFLKPDLEDPSLIEPFKWVKIRGDGIINEIN